MPSVKILKAIKLDDKDLINFSNSFPSDGGLKLALDRSPSYFESLSKEGLNTDIIIGKDNITNEIVGIGHRTELSYFLFGEKIRLGYLSGLRLLKKYRSGIALARGYLKLKELHERSNCKGYLTTIQSENKTAIQILESGRAGLPKYQFIDHLTTFVWLPGVLKEETTLQIQKLSNSTGADLIEEIKRSSFLFPEIPDSIYEEKGFSKYLIYSKEELIASFALWDQKEWKQWKVLGYQGQWRILRYVYNFWANLNKMPCLPKPGLSLSYIFLTQLKIKESQIHLFPIILKKIFQQTRLTFPNTYICFTIAKKDPKFPFLKNIPAWKIESRGYFVSWRGDDSNFIVPDGGFSEWEAGLL
ncbi:hypothetical protein [Leptospira brenneri]|uniref:GNAT family N-acetyltransferase n=1 Tax=Leptospira brenneri TaxID=2023182 RepID=A0A2M9XX05_9LEPT|nr:hypothetical protein [Leptospira brenneri]PJZ43834.1 hypothetical protein CH361_18320 [Leptospira brenneri]TGK92409.1 hypothetical protein EHQ30_13210 [Leptospira brenneri]